MRLLDLISQERSACIPWDDDRNLPGADRFKQLIRECPLRYVLSDDLVRCATQLAYAEGDRLSACLDLIHIPAHTLWIEWADGPRREALKAIPSLKVQIGPSARRGGALVMAAPDCRSGQIRTFWSARDELAYLSPIVTTFDLDRSPETPSPSDPKVWRGEARLRMESEPAIEELLGHLRFHLDDEWAAYYHERCQAAQLRATVLRTSLGGCAFDGPMLMAFFLLLGARNLLPRQQICHERLNRVRRQSGKPPLLEHIELSAPLDTPPSSGNTRPGEPSRLSPRLHHVRGHLVRRGFSVFWRSPHLRGSARLGRIRTRTVELSFAQQGATTLASAAHASAQRRTG
jgi:hypothetical protein